MNDNFYLANWGTFFKINIIECVTVGNKILFAGETKEFYICLNRHSDYFVKSSTGIVRTKSNPLIWLL